MVEVVHARRNAETKEERHDLFSGLLDAARDEPNGGVAISEEELIGERELSYCSTIMKKVLTYILVNMFIFLLVGHEVGHCTSSVI